MIHIALEFAAKMHQGQFRKGTDIPYIMHPAEVMYILTKAGADEDTIVAGILHDVVEDAGVTLEQITNLFGESVAALVCAESEDKSKTWCERKTKTIEELKTAKKEIRLIACADKISNLKSICYDIKRGFDVWPRFGASYAQIKWYYKGLLESLKDFDNPLLSEMNDYYYKIFEV